MPIHIKPKEAEHQLLSKVPSGLLGVQSVPRNRRVIQYELSKKKNDLTMAGDDEQNTFDMLQAVSHLVKDSCIKPLQRFILMSDNTRETIFNINKVLKAVEKSTLQPTKIPLLFHYDTTFNVGPNHVSILTLRDPTREKIQESSRYCFKEAILPVAVMIHEGRLREQHDAFFRAIDAQFLKGKNGDLSEERPFYLVSDHEFGNVWLSSTTIYCANHLKSNLNQMMSKSKNNHSSSSNQAHEVFYKLIKSKNETDFLNEVSKIQRGDYIDGAMADLKLRNYILKNIVPKIREHSAR